MSNVAKAQHFVLTKLYDFTVQYYVCNSPGAKIAYAMVTNHLWAPYGVCSSKNRMIRRRPYGARPSAGRIVRFFINFLDIVRCPVKFRYYLRFHGARTAFGRVNEGKMTSAGHRTVPGRRPAGVCTYQTGTGRFFV